MQVQLVTFCHPTTQQRRLTPPLQLASIHLHGIRSQRRNFTEGAHLRITLFPPTHALPAAAKWYGVAAEMGDVGGMVALGGMVLKGLGVPANASEALRLFQKVPTVTRLNLIAINGFLFL
jgi:hypothetical protein